MLPASLCAKIMVFRRITRIIEVVLNERAVTIVFLLVFISSKRLFYKPILFKFNQIKGSKNMNHQLHFNLFSILFGFIILQY